MAVSRTVCGDAPDDRAGDGAADLRTRMRAAYLAEEAATVRGLAQSAALGAGARAAISARAVGLVRRVRGGSDPGIMETFLAEYGLSSKEGVALMCLAEALLRVPDAATIDALIQDKIVPADWGRHLGRSSSPLVNASTWALMLTGRILAPEADEGLVASLRELVRRLGEPVVRAAVGQAMRELGHQFVLGRTIAEATGRAEGMEARGYVYSYDMLGEAARTEKDARRYRTAYSDAISALAARCRHDDIRMNPGISIKLSALHPRYEFGQRDRVLNELAPRALSLALLAKSANMGFNIDAEEADRLDLSLDVIEEALSDPGLAGWDGFGVAVQAYGQRAGPVLDWLYDLAGRLGRRIVVRLVKGAYWDTEIKRAQTLGLDGFPVFTRKVSTDLSYIACARKLLAMTDRVYPQFATHNAHTAAAVLHMAGNERADGGRAFEFQRLHGMGEALHDAILKSEGTRCRIYAPVGAHRDLLAYLVRRLLENGANSSFVNRIVDEAVAPEEIARDPFAAAASLGGAIADPNIAAPADLFGAGRRNARGWDIADPSTVTAIDAAREPFRTHVWSAGPMIAGSASPAETVEIVNPARPDEPVGRVAVSSPADMEAALTAAQKGFQAWSATPTAERAEALRRAADLYEANAPELFALAAREAGKTVPDAVGEIREAVDFLRYYAGEAERLDGAGEARGVFACISPWNFPLAIFTGQIAAALAAGNAAIAKPAEQTSLIAARATALLHDAGVPRAALQLLPGAGPAVGAPLASDPRVAGVCFTGSTQTARRIDRIMAETVAPDAPLIAETGGLNAMIVDSTALPEQAVRDILASAFQSAGQRCSALRMLYVQADVAERVEEMLCGAMEELRLGDPWDLSTDIGPAIDREAKRRIDAHCARMEADGRLLKKLGAPGEGLFCPPTALRVSGIGDLGEEIFGPVLHIASFAADGIDAAIDAINASGYGLTFGLHTRIEDRVQRVIDRIRAGNIYINRNQIGAVVGSQPFGGEGLSGSGPKAGGPRYVKRFMRMRRPGASRPTTGATDLRMTALQTPIDATVLQAAVDRLAPTGALAAGAEALEMPGPTGESNRLSDYPRGVVLCLGPDEYEAAEQAKAALAVGNRVVIAAPGGPAIAASLRENGAVVVALDGAPAPEALTRTVGIDAVACAAGSAALADIRRALAARDGALVPLVADHDLSDRFVLERHVCVDTTAAGGNASLLAAVEA